MALTRRTTLLAGAALGGAALLSGCADEARPDPGAAERSAAAERVRTHAARDSRALLARYDATLAAHPGLGARLRVLRDEVAHHIEAFTSGAPSTAPTASATSATSAASGSAPDVPADERSARAALADAERTLADSRTAALVSAPPELARLLASVAAAGAAHAYLLTEAE